MNTYLVLFIISTIASLILTPVISRLSRRFGWLDVPRDARRVHETPTPRLGGAAIFAAMALALTTVFVASSGFANLLTTNSAQLLSVIVPASIIFFVGIYDDFVGANATIKFAIQALAGLVFCAMGGRIQALSIPLVGSVELHPFVGYALTLIWTVGISNAFNLIDGMDGLASGASLFAAIVMLIVSLILGQPLITVFSIVLCGCLIGFLPYNFHPASIFLGDSGALFIGFMLAALSVLGTQKASTAVAVTIPIIAFGVPVFDTGLSIVRRFIGGRPLFQGDREHIHHMLLARGWSQRRATLVLYGVCALFGMAALLLVNAASMRTTGLVLAVVGTVMVFGVLRLRYHEVDELAATLRRSFLERRLRVANNIRVRRASRTLSHANSLNEIFLATQELLEVGDFVYATMQLGRGGNTFRLEHKLAEERESLMMRGKALIMRHAEVRNGAVCWRWQRGEVDPEDIIGSVHYWTLRLPLSTRTAEWGYLNVYREFGGEALLLDINYLCDLFQREMAKAVERVLQTTEDQPEAPAVAQLAVGYGGGNLLA
jgi:UDP-GlcNAc:undecaprenyl-phosphate/decaprenyl-phosphate GlcNAc-1-phosphate transferase